MRFFYLLALLPALVAAAPLPPPPTGAPAGPSKVTPGDPIQAAPSPAPTATAAASAALIAGKNLSVFYRLVLLHSLYLRPCTTLLTPTGLTQASTDGAAEAAAQAAIATAISGAQPESVIAAAVAQAQSALTTAEAQRAKNQALATNAAEKSALASLANLQTTEAQPLINTLKTPAGQTAANAAQLLTIFQNGAAFNNAAKTAAVSNVLRDE